MKSIALHVISNMKTIYLYSKADKSEPELGSILENTFRHCGFYWNSALKVNHDNTGSFIGLFVDPKDAALLKEIALEFVRRVSLSGEQCIFFGLGQNIQTVTLPTYFGNNNKCWRGEGKWHRM